MPILKACIIHNVKQILPSRVPTDFGVRSHARLDFIEDFDELLEKYTYDCRTQVNVTLSTY